MCETKVVVVSISMILLVAASFCIYQAHADNKVGHHHEIKNHGSCENEYKKYCLNGGECYYLVDEDIVGCKGTWFYGARRCEKYMWWTRLDFKIDKHEKKLVKILHVVILFIQNLTRRKKFISKSDALYFFLFKIWCLVFFLSFQNLTHIKNFNSKSGFLKKHEKCKICRFHWTKVSKMWLFEGKRFFKNRQVEKFLFQNLTRFFFLKICLVENFLIWNLLFKSSFQMLAELLSKCYQHQWISCWKMRRARVKKIFYECVACVCLTFGTVFLVIAFFMAIGFLMGVMTNILSTTYWFVRIPLEFKNWLVYKDFFLKDTK